MVAQSLSHSLGEVDFDSRDRGCPLCANQQSDIFFQMTREFLVNKHGNSEEFIDLILLDGKKSVDIVVCRKCQMVYTKNFYDFSLIREKRGDPKDTPLSNRDLKEAHKHLDLGRFIFSFQVVQTLMSLVWSGTTKDLRLLDYGGGYVGFHARLSNLYGPIQCFSFDPVVSEGNVDGVRFLNKLEDVKNEGPYDAIVCNEVLEHCLDPRLELKRIYEFLKPGGYAFLAVPLINYGRLKRIRDDIKHQRGEAKKKFHVGHINYFSITNFCALIKECGLSIVPVQLDFLAYRPNLIGNNYFYWHGIKAIRYLGFRICQFLGWYAGISKLFLSHVIVRKSDIPLN